MIGMLLTITYTIEIQINKTTMKSFLSICLLALCGSTLGFAPMSSFTANQMDVNRGSSMLSMNAAEKTYIM
jgi:hypothetical protein